MPLCRLSMLRVLILPSACYSNTKRRGEANGMRFTYNFAGSWAVILQAWPGIAWGGLITTPAASIRFLQINMTSPANGGGQFGTGGIASHCWVFLIRGSC